MQFVYIKKQARGVYDRLNNSHLTVENLQHVYFILEHWLKPREGLYDYVLQKIDLPHHTSWLLKTTDSPIPRFYRKFYINSINLFGIVYPPSATNGCVWSRKLLSYINDTVIYV